VNGFTVDPEALAAAVEPLRAMAADIERQATTAPSFLAAAAGSSGQSALEGELQRAAGAAGHAMATGSQLVNSIASLLATTAQNYVAANAHSTIGAR
jgi:uncharacterized membrane protein